MALKTEATMFECPHLHNAWTNLHGFWRTSTVFCSEHTCWLYVDHIYNTKWCQLAIKSTTDNLVFTYKTRMWANAQRDGRAAEYRWRRSFNAAKFGWRPLLKCCAVTLPKRKTCWNLLGCTKLANRSQPLVGRSPPYCKDMWADAVQQFFSDCRCVP